MNELVLFPDFEEILKNRASAADLSAGLHDMATWVSENSDALRWGGVNCRIGVDNYVGIRTVHVGDYRDTAEESGAKKRSFLEYVTRVLKRGAAIGEVKKESDRYAMKVVRNFSPAVQFTATIWDGEGAVCELVDTGETIEQIDYEIPDHVRDRYKVITHKPKLERVCDPILAPS